MDKTNWIRKPLSRLCTMKYGKMPKKEDLVDEGYPIFSGYRIVGSHREYLYKDPEVVVIARGVGGTGDVKMSPPKCYVTNLSIVLSILNITAVHKQFLYWKLKSENLRRLDSGSAQSQITISNLKTYEITFPKNIKTQKKIAGVLSAYDDLIENNNRRIHILEDMAQKLYKHWFIDFKFPNHENTKFIESELGLIPEGWEIKIVKEFGKIHTGKTPSKKKTENFGGNIPFIKTPDMHDGIFCIKTGEYLSEIGALTQRKKILPPDSLCVSCIGSAGIVSITTVPAQTNQQINSIILNNLKDREFLYFVLCDLKETIKNYGATGATMTNLSKGKFEELKVVYPTKDLIKQYNKKAKLFFNKIKVLSYENNNLTKTRDLFLPRLISGDLSIEDMEIAA